MLLAPPSAATQQQFITDSQPFGSDAERLGNSNSFVLSESDIQGLLSRADHIETEADYRSDAVYGPGDLTLYSQTPTIQRDTPLMAERAFPIDPESKAAGFGMKYVDLLDISKFGEAGFVRSSDDFPMVEFKGRSYQSSFATLGIGWKQTFEEREQDKFSRRNFNQRSGKKGLCVTALRQGAEKIAFQGATSRKILGLLNNPFIPRMSSPVRFDGATDPNTIRRVITTALDNSYLGSKGTAMKPNAIIGSATRLAHLRSEPISTTRDTSRSILDYALSGKGVSNTFDSFYMEGEDGPVNTHSMLFYKRDRACISWHYPVSYQFLTLFNYMGYEDLQLCVARVGSLWPKYPEDTLLLTGI